MSFSLQFQNRGSKADFALGTPDGWTAFDVVRWHAVEEVSRPFEYDITLLRDTSLSPVDLDTLLDASATFRIATQGRWRPIHGILAEAEEIDRTAALILYRVLLVPPIWHAKYRWRCRNFVDQTLQDIMTAVLENRSPEHPTGHLGLPPARGTPSPPEASPSFSSFTPPIGRYRWAVSDTSRITDAKLTPYVVQYNESDFAFLSRLLEQEGISYWFEHADDAVVMTLTDLPGVKPACETEQTITLRGVSVAGSIGSQEIVRSLRDARRLRSRAVTMRDYDYHRSRNELEGEATVRNADADAAGSFGFPAGDELDETAPALHAAQIRLDRCEAERNLREGTGSVRTMEPGLRFVLTDADQLRPNVELLTVRVETYAVQLAPAGTVLDQEPFGFPGAPAPSPSSLSNQFLALSASLRYRPALATEKPLIHGVQAAVVTAEEHAGDRPKINADALGCVRVRFPWDQRPDAKDGRPSSHWLRVSQYWAGSGFGALYTPRVGHEVLVAYMQGDPDRPVIVGRVYNPQSPPPYDASKKPTVSTVKSDTSPKGPGFNELRFEDLTGKEEVFLHAQRDLNEVVLGSHSTSVGGVQTNSVGRHRIHTVMDYETVTVVSDRTTNFQANEHHTVDGFQDTHIGANETHEVGAFRETTIGANDDLHVGAWRNTDVGAGETLNVGATRTVTVKGDHTLTTLANHTSNASANHVFNSTNAYFRPSGDFQVDSTTAGFNQSASFYVKAAGATIEVSAGMIALDNGAGASIALIGGLIVLNGACVVGSASGPMLLTAGGTLGLVAGGAMGLGAGGDINAKASNVRLNG
jgi:type VI secretion system secreted protein VgrG